MWWPTLWQVHAGCRCECSVNLALHAPRAPPTAPRLPACLPAVPCLLPCPLPPPPTPSRLRPLLPRHAPLLRLHLQGAAGRQAPHRLGGGALGAALACTQWSAPFVASAGALHASPHRLLTHTHPFHSHRPLARPQFERAQISEAQLFQRFFADGRPVDGEALKAHMVRGRALAWVVLSGCWPEGSGGSVAPGAAPVAAATDTVLHAIASPSAGRLLPVPGRHGVAAGAAAGRGRAHARLFQLPLVVGAHRGAARPVALPAVDLHLLRGAPQGE